MATSKLQIPTLSHPLTNQRKKRKPKESPLRNKNQATVSSTNQISLRKEEVPRLQIFQKAKGLRALATKTSKFSKAVKPFQLMRATSDISKSLHRHRNLQVLKLTPKARKSEVQAEASLFQIQTLICKKSPKLYHQLVKLHQQIRLKSNFKTRRKL